LCYRALHPEQFKFTPVLSNLTPNWAQGSSYLKLSFGKEIDNKGLLNNALRFDDRFEKNIFIGKI
jgi:hypothetical protein